MAYTLAQAAELETMPLKKGIMRNLLREVKLLEYLPFEPVGSLTNIFIRWRSLPSIAFRQINSGYTPSEGYDEPVWESVYIIGGEIKFDRIFEYVQNYAVDPKVNETEKKITALALTLNYYLIHGDHSADALGFEGFKKRVAGMPSRQSLYYAGASAAPLDPTSTVALGNTFFTKLEEQFEFTNRGQVGAIMCNEGTKLGIGRVARYIQASGGAFLDVTKDSFDRNVVTYKGAPIVDTGLKTDQTTEIITNTEVAGDAGADSTSIYMVSFDKQQGCIGIQLHDLAVYDPLNGGEQESTPTKLTRFEWPIGLASPGSYGITRGRNIAASSSWT
jgi:hypothetical protein